MLICWRKPTRPLQSAPSQRGITKLDPSFYVESRGAFAQRFAAECHPALGVACPVTLLQQEDFTEPMVRINTDRIDGAEFGWSEPSAWDAEAEFYQQAAK
jgi:UDP-glucose 4-epimerase